ncbi:hypothetical protein [Brucella intermedia]|uniref:hypothetical protein n=1 Tax=Brucella intermedia TaxID=94625 RepID=UPI00124EA1E4|nr:hypothetical protein [Brucella intermedia]KAB2730057.1 hypothetical protein F9L02_12715 [Brucella intermedia]
MSTSTKSPNTIRQGGPGAAHENAKSDLKVTKPPADVETKGRRSKVSAGGGERDIHHTHNLATKK